MQKFLNIFMNILIVLMVIVCIYFGLNKFVFNKNDVSEKINYGDAIKKFNGTYITDYYDINYSHFIVQKYLVALKNSDLENLNNYLFDDIQSIDIKSLDIGDNIYIKEVRQNTDKTEILITYSTNEKKDDTNTMLCKIDRENQTFLILYDSLIGGSL